MTERALLNPTMIGREFALQLECRIGSAQEVECERVSRPDSFGPVDVIEVRWNGFTAHLAPIRTALSMSLHDYSRIFIQPVCESWIADLQQLARTA